MNQDFYFSKSEVLKEENRRILSLNFYRNKSNCKFNFTFRSFSLIFDKKTPFFLFIYFLFEVAMIKLTSRSIDFVALEEYIFFIDSGYSKKW